MTPVNTKTAERRTLKFHCPNCLKGDLDALEAAHKAGSLRVTGNWSAGQNFQHIAKFMRYSIDGFPPGKPPLLMRVLVQLFFKGKAMQGGAPPAGLKLPKQASFLMPDDNVSFEQGIGELRAQIARIDNGERFSHPSPLFGKLTHEQWTKLHLGHATLHMGFLHPG